MAGVAVIQFVVHAHGTFDVVSDDGALISGARAVVVYLDTHGERKILRTDRAASTSELRGMDENLDMRWCYDGESARVQVRNHGAESVYLEDIHVLAGATSERGRIDLGPVDELSYLQHGWQSWSPVRVRALRAQLERFTGDDFAEKHLPHGWPEDDEVTSAWFTLLHRAGEERAVLFGFVTAADQLSEIRLGITRDELTRIDAICYADGARLDPAQVFRSEKFWIASGTVWELMLQYADRVGAEMGARTHMPALSGWCTWYYFIGENGEEELEANLASIRERRLPFNTILIDDGYQTALGDWTSIREEKFPHGMRAAADTIRAAGMIPGIWLAPFGARHDSILVAQHPEFLLRDAAGEPIVVWHHIHETIYALDLTHPGVLAHLKQLFRTIAEEWGFQLFKLDFIYAGAAPGIHYDRTLTRAQAYRRGLGVIRETLGDDKWIVGCGAPQLASVGLVDAMRVGQDVSIAWKPIEPNPSAPAIVHALQNSMLRLPFHRRLWLNDPDCVIMRTRGNASTLSVNEARTLATVIALTGEMTLDGDNIPTLAPPRVEDLRRILPPLNSHARVVDLFRTNASPPEQLQLDFEREWGNWHVVARINWSGRARDVTIELPDERHYHVYDFWKAQYLGVRQRRVPIDKLAPHATAVLMASPVGDEPRLIASTFHLSGGNAEVARFERTRSAMQIELVKAGIQTGKLAFALPRDWEEIQLRVNGKRRRARKLDEGIYEVKFALDERAVIEIDAK